MLKQRTLLEGYSRDIGVITEADAANDPAPLDFTLRPPRLATIQCVVCGASARIPILADGKLCDLCRMDLPLAESNVRADLKAAEDAHDAAMERLDAVLGQADDTDLARYKKAVTLRESGQHARAVAQRWQEAREKGDGLSPLLEAYDARLAAARALTEALAACRVALGEIEALRTPGGQVMDWLVNREAVGSDGPPRA